ncbi:uncharacterized protein LOC101862320 [Aplysia californica]|uniref:Uncharacterized protein LOC101862320 n=1 Tax=Aplysia californica TaxID=6500 RepID=A0ABM0JDK3_APLCA|nr:uncharacterized protein LOC101862320 [Aplysia californica]
MLWFFRRPKKGMLTLADLDRCHDDQSCDVGLRQILPQDYREPGDSQYTPTHLIWPELMPPSPAPRLSTFTMTNMAPLISTLFSEWHEAVRKVRRFAIEECGVPLVLDSNLKHLSELTSHRLNKSAMFVASGIIPSRDPVVTSGHDVQVPFLFWMAGCCVQQHSKLPAGTEPASRTSGEAVYGSSDESQISSQTNISAFAVYLRNAPLSHVIAAPVLQLEILLQDSYKTKPTDPDVELFPGHESACGDLKNDGSKWFM